ncbi:MAG: hypothetical protein MJ252_00775 [archaeon]|nr:hypothetical protein [archaeon]
MKSFDLAISTISDTQIGLNYLSVFTKKYENDLILAKLPEFSSYSKNLEEGLKSYVSSSKKNTEQAKDLEKTRSLVTILLLVYFIIIIGVSLLGYVMKLDWLVMILGLLTFISIPGVLVFDGYITKFFFYYGDLVNLFIFNS